MLYNWGELLENIKAIVILAAIDWNFLKQRSQHLAEAFSRQGVKVLFIENTGVRTPHFDDWPRLWNRLRNFSIKRSSRGDSEQPGNVEVFSPLAFPFPYNSLSLIYNRHHIARGIESFLEHHDIPESQTVFFSYLATPIAVSLAGEFRWGSIVYDLVSDPKLVEPKLAPHEERFLGKTDLTLFASATLRDVYGNRPPRPLLFRDGYSLQLLEHPHQDLAEVQKLPRPRFLYLGGINRKIDCDYLTALADAYPGGSVILVGPVAQAEITLPERPNISLFPARSRYEEIAGFLSASDAALIPYRLDSYVGMMHPAKINEYMVFGLPIIGTGTQELLHLEAELGNGNLYLAESPEEFAVAAKHALAEDSAENQEKRRKIARLNSWDSRADKLTEIILGGQ